MARAFRLAAFLLCALLLHTATLAKEEEESAQADTSNDLRKQLTVLSQQIKEAEAGKVQAQKLLDSGKAKQEAFRAEIESLKTSVADKDKQESLLQKQIALLQEEAKKLKSDESLHDELKTKFQSVGEELEATKATLANTLQQLADKSGLASSAHSQVAEAERKLDAARAERDAAKKKLEELESNAVDASKVQKLLDAEKANTDKLKGDLFFAQEQAAQLKSALKAAEKEGASWKSKAESAEKAVKGAELKLEKALKEHTSTQSALISAEAKAQEAVQQLEALLTSWLPHWLEQRYHQVAEAVQPAVQRVQPSLETAWKQSKQYSAQGRAKAMWAIGVTRAKSVTAWQSAKPSLERALSTSQKQLTSLSSQARKSSAPYLKKLRVLSRRAFKTVNRYAGEALSHPQVLHVRRRVQQSVKHLEDQLIKYMKRVPQLRPYARRPTVTYLIYAILAAPVITVLVPLLSLKESKAKPVKAETRKISSRDNLPPEQPVARKPKKARRISVGEEHVRVP